MSLILVGLRGLSRDSLSKASDFVLKRIEYEAFQASWNEAYIGEFFSHLISVEK